MILGSDFINLVADHYGISTPQLLGSSHRANISLARHVAIYIIRDSYGLTLKQIGEVFNRDHTTVLYAYNTIDSRIGMDQSLAQDVATLRRRLKQEVS